jgi:hypothetical protein
MLRVLDLTARDKPRARCPCTRKAAKSHQVRVPQAVITFQRDCTRRQGAGYLPRGGDV